MKSCCHVGIQDSLARDFTSAAEAFEMVLEMRHGDRRAQFNLDRVRLNRTSRNSA